MSRRWSDIPGAAEHSGVATSTIRRYIRQGQITGYRLGPRLVRVDLDELDAMLERIPPQGERVG